MWMSKWAAAASAAAIVGWPGIAAGAPYGEIDPAFQAEGVQDRNCGAFTPPAVVADGSAFVWVSPSSTANGIAIAKFRADGALDRAWGDAGLAGVATGLSGPRGLVPLDDGGLLVAADPMSRLDARGRIDTRFGLGGASEPLAAVPSTAFPSGIHSLALLPDGGILVAVHQQLDEAHSRLAFKRLDPLGRRDPSFGSGGALALPLDMERETVYAWSLQSDGTLDVASYTLAGEVLRPQLRRFATGERPPGAPHPPSRLTPLHGVASWTSATAKVDALGRLAILAPGPSSPGQASVTLWRFDAHGNPDAAFGEGGRRTASADAGGEPASARQRPVALYLDAFGALTAWVESSATIARFTVDFSVRVLRFTPDGALDPGFPQRVAISHGFLRGAQLDDSRLLVPEFLPNGGCTLARKRADLPRAEARLVEYFHPALDHFFLTLDGPEAGLLDSERERMGWLRTGRQLGAWMPVEQRGATPVCRFYGDLRAGPNSHFYTPEGSECAGLRAIEAATPPGRPAWRFEGLAFAVSGSHEAPCPPNLTPVYRAYNRGFERGIDSNHRYTTDVALYEALVRDGAAGEGTRFCTPLPASRGAEP